MQYVSAAAHELKLPFSSLSTLSLCQTRQTSSPAPQKDSFQSTEATVTPAVPDVKQRRQRALCFDPTNDVSSHGRSLGY